ncbi:hypothetical protein J3F83DRAFT_734181 [Trichoderma novae-zelandiae]
MCLTVWFGTVFQNVTGALVLELVLVPCQDGLKNLQRARRAMESRRRGRLIVCTLSLPMQQFSGCFRSTLTSCYRSTCPCDLKL